MAVVQKALRALLSDAIVELCRREAFYVEELRIEGTICVVSDRTAALIIQITEQVGDKTYAANQQNVTGDIQLPVILSTNKVDVAIDTQSVESQSNAQCDKIQSAPRMSQRRRRLRVCRHCGARFVRRGSLLSHIRRRHSSFTAQLKPTCENIEDVEHVKDLQTDPVEDVAILKSEPDTMIDDRPTQTYRTEMNLGLQQMVRTLSMMSSLPAVSKSMFAVPPASVSHSSQEDEMQSLHRSADGKFACPYCTKTYGFKHSLKEHIDVHRGRRPHVCRHCGAAFAHLASLCSHIRRRHDDRMPCDFRCTLCGEKLMNLQSLKQHRTWRHKDAPRLSDPLPPYAPNMDKHSETSSPVIEPAVEGRKEISMPAGELGHVSSPLPPLPHWPTVTNNSHFNRGLEGPKLSNAHGSSNGPKDIGDVLPFDGFDFRNYIQPPGYFLSPSASSDWSSSHLNSQLIVPDQLEDGITQTRNITSIAGSKCFVEAVHPHQQQQQQHCVSRSTTLSYRQNTPLLSDSSYVSAVCAGCTAKFRSDSEYRQHIACHPDHVSSPWRL